MALLLEYSPIILAPYVKNKQEVCCIVTARALCLPQAPQALELLLTTAAAREHTLAFCSYPLKSCTCSPASSWSCALQVEILHTEQLRTLWYHMRAAFLHYTTNTDETNHSLQQQEAAHTHMLAYGRLAEQYFGPTVLTF